MSNWYIGQKVVCVESSPGMNNGCPCPLKRGRTYTVSYVSSEVPGIDVLEETAFEGNREYDCYHVKRFRPLEELDLSEELARVEVQRQPLEEREIIREPKRA